ncbi:MAG: UDP-N-acetylmuramoyl-tripeptide--D-alanyl-D-alanine ligase [Oscillospiraceae bacterium]|nr:UDP-N-acetylmuramoyl-tripeptide--D-alanyl-D-alanine ligase [Oscillospiraceae bacterium]
MNEVKQTSGVTLKQIASWCGGAVSHEHESIVINGFTKDSRALIAGNMYIAIRGARVDGHDYIPQVMDSGAAAVLADHLLPPEIPAVVVKNTETALRAIASGYRATMHAKVLAITGSVGKTTTKEMLAAIMNKAFATGKTPANYNNNIGMPLSILNMDRNCQIAVLEMGMNHFGEMSELTHIARPNIAAIINIGTMHIENLHSRKGILKAKLEIVEGLQPGGVLVFNGDEPMLTDLRGKYPFRTLYFGITNKECDVIAENIAYSEDSTTFDVHGLGKSFKVKLPTEGMHNVYNALAAITMALESGAQPEHITAALQDFTNASMRLNTYERSGYTIIDDCYNAGPESTAVALGILGRKKTDGSRIAVLGDMLELGRRANAEHYRIGRIAAQNADLILAYGKTAERIVSGALTGGVSQRNVVFFDSQEEVVKTLLNRTQPGDVILFKGSRGVHMERVLAMFEEQADKKLAESESDV